MRVPLQDRPGDPRAVLRESSVFEDGLLPPPRHAARRSRFSGPGLRLVVVALDALAIAMGWAVGAALVDSPFPHRAWSHPPALVFLFALVPVALVVNHAFRLYRASSCAMAMLEISLLARATVATAVVSLAGAQALDLQVADRWVVVSTLVTLVLTAVLRSVLRTRLAALRKRGQYLRQVVIVGANDEAFDLWQLLEDHPEVGFRVAGVVGDRSEHERHPQWAPLLGSLDEAAAHVEAVGATGVFVAATAMSCRELNVLCRQLLEDGVHVQVASGLRGIDQRRVTPYPVAREPMFYVQAARLSRRQEVLKRAFDLAAGVVILLLAMPVMALAAAAIAVREGRPVFFRQYRVGRDGQQFKILKFRTMVCDAESMLIDLRDHNERQGPLFKVSDDPRVTPVGRFLRESSIDELPQLFNVLSGKMSLVGPRPALPSETETFDEELMARHEVKPGITGLWQVHSRDSGSFSSYQRLDLFYVENWSLAMDVAILATTVPSVLWRGYRRLVQARRRAHGAAPVLDGGDGLALAVAPVRSSQRP